MSPKRIAWRGGASAINGSRKRGAGILDNELYIGRLIWNRLRYDKDPETGRRRSRGNQTRDVVAVEVGEPRIVSDELWTASSGGSGDRSRGAWLSGGVLAR
jgi:site-specific DNA recombinase